MKALLDTHKHHSIPGCIRKGFQSPENDILGGLSFRWAGYVSKPLLKECGNLSVSLLLIYSDIGQLGGFKLAQSRIGDIVPNLSASANGLSAVPLSGASARGRILDLAEAQEAFADLQR